MEKANLRLQLLAAISGGNKEALKTAIDGREKRLHSVTVLYDPRVNDVFYFQSKADKKMSKEELDREITELGNKYDLTVLYLPEKLVKN